MIDEVLNHRNAQIGGAVVGLVALLLYIGSFAISIAAITVVGVAGGVVYWRQELEQRSKSTAIAHGRKTTKMTQPANRRQSQGSGFALSPMRDGPSARSIRDGGMTSKMFGQSKMGSLFANTGVSTLPRVRRVNDRAPDMMHPSNTSQRVLLAASRRYPTHQPRYNGVGILPNVQLHQPVRPVLTDHNSSMLRVSNTIKIAPPDVLKPPTPSVMIPDERSAENRLTPVPDTEAVMTALRDKRKRTRQEHEDESLLASPQEQLRKRRKQVTEGDSDGERLRNGGVGMDVMPSLNKRTKRAAASQLTQNATSPSELEDEQSAKRSRRYSGQGVSGARNPVDVSFSSSRRWLEKLTLTRSRSNSRESSVVSHGRCRSGERSGCTSRNSSFSHISAPDISDGVIEASRQSTPRRSMNAEDESFDKADTPPVNELKRKLFPLKKQSTTRLRSTVLRGSVPTNLSRVPTLRTDLTMADFDQDNRAELDRLEQMLQNVEETASKGSASPAVSSSATTTASLLTSTTLPASSSQISSKSTNSMNALPVLSSLLSEDNPTISTSAATTVPSISITSPPQTSESKISSASNVLGSAPAAAAAFGGFMKSTTATSGISSVSSSAPISSILGTAPVLGGGFTAVTSTPSALGGVTSTSTVTKPSPLAAVTSIASVAPSLATPSLAPSTTSVESVLFSHKPVFTSAPASAVSPPKPVAATSTASSAGGFTFGLTSSAPATSSSSPFTFGASATSVAATSTSSSGLSLSSNTSSNSTFGITAQPSNAGGISSDKPSTFQFGAATQSAMPAASTITFGAPSSKAPSLPPAKAPTGGSITFGTPNNPTSAASSGGFTFGQAATTSANSSSSFAFGSSNATTSSAGAATFGSSSTMPSTAPFSFSANEANKAPAPASNFAFGTSSTPAMPAFGQSTTTTTASSAFGFNTAATTSSSSIFGNAAPSAATASMFGGTTQATTALSVFGTSTPATTASSFAFGGGGGSAAPSMFGQSSSSLTTPGSFGNQDKPAPSFQFGSSAPQSTTFQFGQANSTQGTVPAFGQSNAKPSAFPSAEGAFGATNSMTSTPTFGASQNGTPTLNGFGNSTNFASSGSAFGTPTTTAASSGLNFGSTPSKGTITFGQSNTQPAQSSGGGGGFNFSAAANAGSSGGGGFNFSAGSSGATAFGAPSTPNNSAGGQGFATPGGMFSVGSGNTGAKPRPVRTARRRQTKR